VAMSRNVTVTGVIARGTVAVRGVSESSVALVLILILVLYGDVRVCRLASTYQLPPRLAQARPSKN
jgi:hypothetical protein